MGWIRLMKKEGILPGIALLGFGLYYMLQQFNIEFMRDYYSWPTLFIIIGAALLAHGYIAGQHEAILPGTVLAGFGLHFTLAGKLAIWPDHAGILLLIIALGFLLRYVKAGTGLLAGLLLLAASIYLLFSRQVIEWSQEQEGAAANIADYWPLALIAAGAYFLFFKRK